MHSNSGPYLNVVKDTVMALASRFRVKIRVVRGLGFKKLIALIPAMIFLGILLIIAIFKNVRVHRVYNSRIGHFALNTAISVGNSKNRQPESPNHVLNIYCFESLNSANKYLESLWKETLTCFTGNFGWALLDLARRIKKIDFFVETEAIDRGDVVSRFHPIVNIPEDDVSLGFRFLANFGVDIESKFVCLNVRDENFLKFSQPIGWHSKRDWGYHGYRDSDIRTYLNSAETLAELGYTVFRMGAIVKDTLGSQHPKVIDYATNGMRTEFLDIFLAANCKFCISSGSGWDSVVQLFRRNLMWVNYLPMLNPAMHTTNVLVYPKSLIRSDSREVMSLRQSIEANVAPAYSSKQFKDAGVEIRDLSSEELVEAVTEMAQRVEGTFVETPEQKEMQAKLKHILSTHPKMQPSPNYYPIRAQFASCFLSRYPNFLDGLD
jgi:putative glycosyltransferase (TIGR04372 family)